MVGASLAVMSSGCAAGAVLAAARPTRPPSPGRHMVRRGHDERRGRREGHRRRGAGDVEVPEDTPATRSRVASVTVERGERGSDGGPAGGRAVGEAEVGEGTLERLGAEG